MAAPLLAGVGKFVAKQIAARAANKAAEKARGGKGGDEGDDNDALMGIATVVAIVVILVIIGSIINGIIVGASSPLSGIGKSKGDDFCSVTTAMIDEWEAEDAEHGTDDELGEIQGPLAPGGGGINRFSPVGQLPDLTDGVMAMPIGNVTPVRTSPYGPRRPPKAGATSNHRGVDYGHPAGTPTVAIGPGVVTWAGYIKEFPSVGKMVKVQHKYKGGIITTAYFHHSTINVNVGDVVTTGQQLGGVGKTGNSTGNHLHFEIWLGTTGGSAVDPEVFMRDNAFVTIGKNDTVAPTVVGTNDPNSILKEIYGDDELAQEIAEECNLNAPDPNAIYPAGQGAGPWGGHPNGEIPASQMLRIPWVGAHHMLRPDATRALIELNKEFKARFGYDIGITDSYRTYNQQERLKKQKPLLAAKAGTSNHGWGLALDLASNIDNFNSETHKWMKNNAPRFGWVNPGWAQVTGDKPEPWHWEFMGVPGGDINADGKTKAGAQQLARAMIGQYSWDETEFQCLDKLWIRESQWNYKAENKSSGAYGIPQSLPGNKMADVDSDWRDNPKTQITWGLKYIKDRYKTPCKAWDHSERKNWY